MSKSSRRFDVRARPVFALEGPIGGLYLDRVRRLPKVAATTADLELEDRTVSLTVRRSGRARRLLLRVDAAGEKVELVLPHGVGLPEGMRFAKSHADWLRARLAARPPRIAFSDGAIISVLGAPLRLRHRPDARGGAWVEDGDLNVTGLAEHLPRRVKDWLIGHARSALGDSARRHAEALGRKFRRLTLRDPRTQWGSCSATGDLSFSWRLILAPPEVLDYVVAHEVAHLSEANHGPRFWTLVTQLIGADYRSHRVWLRRHGATLLRYG